MPETRPAPVVIRPGLDHEEVARRLVQEGPNLLPGSTPKALLAIVFGVVTEPMFLMLLVAGGIYLALGGPAEALLLLGHATLAAHGWQETDSRGAVFIGLVLGLFMLILANRDLSRPAMTNLVANNPWILRVFLMVMVLLVVVFVLPFLRRIMGFAPADSLQLLTGLAYLAGAGVWLETLRRVSG